MDFLSRKNLGTVYLAQPGRKFRGLVFGAISLLHDQGRFPPVFLRSHELREPPLVAPSIELGLGTVMAVSAATAVAVRGLIVRPHIAAPYEHLVLSHAGKRAYRALPLGRSTHGLPVYGRELEQLGLVYATAAVLELIHVGLESAGKFWFPSPSARPALNWPPVPCGCCKTRTLASSSRSRRIGT